MSNTPSENTPQDIMMEALELTGREVKIFTQGRGTWGGVAIWWGTILGLSDKDMPSVIVGDFRAGYADSERLERHEVEAASIIHIEAI